jgi:hypothetical protein
MSEHGHSKLDLSSYPKLETVRFSYWATGCSLDFAFTHFLAPALHIFTWDFGSDQHPNVVIPEFTLAQADRIHKLALVAVAQKSALRNIHIITSPSLEHHLPTSYSWTLDLLGI